MTGPASRGRRPKTTRPSDLEKSQTSASGTPNLFKEMNISVEKRRDARRQELRRQHGSLTKKAEENIRDAFRVNKSVFDEYRRSRMGRLSELIKKRTELEVKIISLLQSAKDAYEATHDSMSTSLEKRLVSLRQTSCSTLSSSNPGLRV